VIAFHTFLEYDMFGYIFFAKF